MKRATGIKMRVMKQIAEIIAAGIRVSNLLHD